MSSDLYTNYRGDVRAVAATEGCLLLVTVHPEGQSTSLYLINLETNKLHQIALPTGGVSLLVTPKGWWIGGTDRGLHHIFSGKGSPEVRVFPFEDVPRALAPLSAERLAVAVGAHVAVVDRKEGRVLQQLDLPENVTCLAADPTGQWLTVGTTKGTVAVFECETDPATFQLSDSQPLTRPPSAPCCTSRTTAFSVGRGRPETPVHPCPRQAGSGGPRPRRQP